MISGNLPAPPARHAETAIFYPQVVCRYSRRAIDSDPTGIDGRPQCSDLVLAPESGRPESERSSNSVRRTWLSFLAVLLIVIVTLISPLAAPTSADNGDEGTLVLSPTSVAPGDTVTVTGSGLPVDEDGEILWADEDVSIAPVHTDGTGMVVATFVAPDWESGDYDVAIEIGSADAKATLTIVAPVTATVAPTIPVNTPAPTNAPTESVDPSDTIAATETRVDKTATPEATETSTKAPTPTSTQVQSVSAAAEDTIWVSTNGSDSNTGTEAKPYRSLQKALSVVTAGKTINLKAGTYTLSDTAMTTNGGHHRAANHHSVRTWRHGNH